MNADEARLHLVAMSNELGDPAHDYVILGEGNTSAAIDGGASFWVKASGASMRGARPEDFVEVESKPILDLLQRSSPISDDDVRAHLIACRVDPSSDRLPSVETLLHAACLRLNGVQFVGHTHPTAVNMILCSDRFPGIFAGRLFPDEIVMCGPAPVLIPYVDPGVPLARAVNDELNRYLDVHGEWPRVILMQNHGLVVLGASPRQVLDTTVMMVKTARILVGAASIGSPRFLCDEHVARIHGRPDEHYRQRIIEDRSG